MRTQAIHDSRSPRGFVSAKVALVLAVIVGGTGFLVYEWNHAHAPAKQHHIAISTGSHHHHKKDGKTKLAN
jgi:hypothetical protein